MATRKSSREIKDALREAETIGGNVAKQLEKVIELQSKHLKISDKLNLSANLLNSIKEKQHSTDKLMEVVQESIFKKTQKLTDLARKTTPLTAAERAAKARLLRQLEAANVLYSGLLFKSTMFKSALSGIAGQAGMGKLVSLTQTLGNLWKIHPLLAAVSATLTIVGKIVDVFKQLDEAAWNFRKTLGITRTVTKDIDNFVRATATDLAHVGVTANQLYNSYIAISSVTGTIHANTKAMATDMAILSAQLGISETTSANFLKTMAMMGRTTMDAQRNMLYFASAMSEAAGTNLNEVMSDVAAASKNGYRFLSRSPIELVKATIEAKKLGMSLEKITSSADNLIEFTKSVNAEMEASVLLGRSINLQRARELAYRKDLKGLTQEILKIAQETDFEHLDPFQQKAVAAALGKSADEVGTMLQAAREQREIEAAINRDPKLRERKRLLDDMTKATQSQAKNYAEIARKQLSTQYNQSRITGITQAWNKILMKVAYVFLPAIDVTLGFIADHLGKILIVSTLIGASFMKWGSLARLGPFLARLSPMLASLGPMLSGMFASIGTGLVAAITSPITAVLAAFAGGFGIGTLLNKLEWVQDAATNLWLAIFKIGDGIAAVSKSIYEGLKKPFVKTWDWLKTTFLGESPSKLGLLIVEGLKAVQSMLVNLLVSPFKMAWNIIKEIPFVGKLFKNIGTSVAEITKPIVTTDKTIPIPSESIKINDIRPTVIKSDEEFLRKLDEITAAVNRLTAGFADGKLKATVNMDSQKVDAAMGRAKEFKGELVS